MRMERVLPFYTPVPFPFLGKGTHPHAQERTRHAAPSIFMPHLSIFHSLSAGEEQTSFYHS